LYPKAKVVTNEKCKEFLMDLLHIPQDKFKVVADGQTLSLGDKSLKFIYAPWVHWPETILTYLPEDKILFPCDLFGSHLASNELYVKDEAKVYDAAKRYYAEIMMPFRALIKGHLEKIKDLEIDLIAPSHGQVYDRPDFILDAYRDWISDDVKNEVVIPYVSMHESTRVMVDHLIDALTERGIKAKPYNLTKTDVGELAMETVDAATIVLASPTFLTGAHPAAYYATYLVNALRPKTRLIGIIGSYGWGSLIGDQLRDLLTNLKVEVLEPVLVKGLPKEADLKALDAFADEIAEKHRKYKILGS
jgi:flavorubredoxin